MPNLPVIVVSGSGVAGDVAEAMKCGACKENNMAFVENDKCLLSEKIRVSGGDAYDIRVVLMGIVLCELEL